MNYSQEAVQIILKKVAQKKLSAARAFEKLKHLSYETLSIAKLDHHRGFRKNLPEVVYGENKTLSQLKKITASLFKSKSAFLITRLDEKKFRALRKQFPALSYSKEARLAWRKTGEGSGSKGWAAVVTAGTSDIPAAEEAAVTLEAVGKKVKRFYDVGVAGLQRLLDSAREIEKASVVICAAGMEGALPSVLAGVISKPVIAVPTSVGYGASFKGLAALLAMMNSCAQGVAVVNIDSGFSAACFASLLLDQIAEQTQNPKLRKGRLLRSIGIDLDKFRGCRKLEF